MTPQQTEAKRLIELMSKCSPTSPVTIHLRREDINNPIHPDLWGYICEQVGCPDAEELELRVIKAEGY